MERGKMGGDRQRRRRPDWWANCAPVSGLQECNTGAIWGDRPPSPDAGERSGGWLRMSMSAGSPAVDLVRAPAPVGAGGRLWDLFVGNEGFFVLAGHAPVTLFTYEKHAKPCHWWVAWRRCGIFPVSPPSTSCLVLQRWPRYCSTSSTT